MLFVKMQTHLADDLNFFYPLYTRRHVRFFFFNDTATTEIYTLSLHDALPIFIASPDSSCWLSTRMVLGRCSQPPWPDRKSTRLNSSHSQISYAVFCLKKKRQSARLLTMERTEHGYYVIARSLGALPSSASIIT